MKILSIIEVILSWIFAIFLFGMVWSGLKSGLVRSRYNQFTRSKSPGDYWMIISMYIVGTLAAVVSGVMNFLYPMK